jgi:hypothetical protein
MKINKPAILPALILTAAALMPAGCGKTGSAGSPAPAKTAAKSADGKEYTPAAKTMMASLGKTIKGTRLVYYFDTPSGREYTVVEYENGSIKSEWKYCFFPPKYDFAYKTAANGLLKNNMLKEADKDDAALWYRTQEEYPSKMTWQKYYDGFKSMKTFTIVE